MGLHSPVLFTGLQQRNKNMRDWKQYIIEKYKPHGLRYAIDKNDRMTLNWEAMITQQQPMNIDRSKVLWVPRTKTFGNGLFQTI